MTDDELLADDETIVRLLAASRFIAVHLDVGAPDLHVDDLRTLLADALTLVDELAAGRPLADDHAVIVERLAVLGQDVGDGLLI
jgi:hypothetical protein